jgi:LysM repeat protein
VAGSWGARAKRYGAPVAFLLAVTIAVLLVRAGLKTDSDGATTATTVATTVVKTTPVPPRKRRFYRLRAGETLSDVAIKFDTGVAELLALNPGIEPTNLRVGQRIRVK